MRHSLTYVCTFMVFFLFGPVVGTAFFSMYFGINPLHEAILPFAVIGGLFIGVMPAGFTGLLFYPVFIVIKKSNKSFSNGTLGLFIGAFLGALSLFFFYLTGSIKKTNFSDVQLSLLLPLMFLAPGGVLGYISAKIVERINSPNR